MEEPAIPRLLQGMKRATARQLREHLIEHGEAARSLSLFEFAQATGLRRTPAERVRAWLHHYGDALPGDDGRPERTPDPELPPSPVASPLAVPPRGRGRRHLVFGDAHAEPHESLARFLWGGRMAADLLDEGDLVVHLGDWYDLASLCKHATPLERGKERVTAEIAAGQQALELWHKGLGTKDCGGIEHALTLGNHDDRLARLAHEAPWLEGAFDVGAAHRARGWTVAPYLAPYRADGVCYQHYATHPQSGRAIGGKYTANRALEVWSFEDSMVVGHSHLLQVAHRGMRGGRQRWGISAGCFFEHSPSYAGRGAEQWWRGALLFHDVADGCFDVELFSMDRIRSRWGS